ncbi:helix-turn-helix domain-containing protein [Streptomyces sp. ActVer]|uniref:helix-turn-helix domain-containing protein n=1 Tax=Streptomyces sp. ActVer TaxID=3014558 RepID=UPI0022B410DC|nr:helix-turn-helix domain-containing protein [Streptomyces sp. ActVer]MCZ4506766.1 helix-turn-helix domain-containing protein [Streptomyces sp. ActVer]
MSYDAREWVWDHSRSKGTARMVLALIADRCRDRHCVAYASVATLMKRANASRTAVRDALAKLIADGELVPLPDRKGPRGETYYCLPIAARYLADEPRERDRNPAPQGGRNPTLGGSESDPAESFERGSESGPGEQNPAPRGYGFRPEGGADSDPQNRREPKVNGKSSSSAPLISATEWQIDDNARAWLQHDGHLDRLGEHALHAADAKWRTYRSSWDPRTADAWAADWRAWIAREHTPTPGRPSLYALPGGTPTPTSTNGMTRSEAHMAALLAALDEPTGTE